MHANSPDDPDGRVAAIFAREIPAIAAGQVVIRALARDPGVRTKVAVSSDSLDVDAMAACLGEQGSRLASIASALGGEAVHVATWSPEPAIMIRRALSPLQTGHVELHEASRRATVHVPGEQSPNVLATVESQRDLASRLSGWHIRLVIDRELG